MHLLTLGLNHRTAPLAVRERVAVSADHVSDALADLQGRLSSLVPERAILSTCHRTELYCMVHEPEEARRALVGWLAERSLVAPEHLRSHLYALPTREAVQHAFRVASGLDSMVLGEPQIFGQMKDAARQAQAAGALGPYLHQLFQRSFAVAKEVRRRTEIGAGSVSLAAAAVRLAQRVFPDLAATRLLCVGAGEMIELALMHFHAHRPREIVVANRTVERAGRLARRFAARVIPLAEVPEALAQFDIVVSSTASALPIFGLGMVERASRARQPRPTFMVDLAVPRDIEAEVGQLPNVTVCTVDDLGEVVHAGAAARRAAVTRAEAIIEVRVQSFMGWMGARRSVPVLRALEERAEGLRAYELERARRRLARGEPAKAVLEALAAGLSNKLLHGLRAVLAHGAVTAEEAQRLVEHCLGAADRERSRSDRERSSGPGREGHPHSEEVI